MGVLRIIGSIFSNKKLRTMETVEIPNFFGEDTYRLSNVKKKNELLLTIWDINRDDFNENEKEVQDD